MVVLLIIMNTVISKAVEEKWRSVNQNFVRHRYGEGYKYTDWKQNAYKNSNSKIGWTRYITEGTDTNKDIYIIKALSKNAKNTNFGTKKPILDHNRGTLCLQHSKEGTTNSEQETVINNCIIVDDKKVIVNYASGAYDKNGKWQSSEKIEDNSLNAARIAYILTFTSQDTSGSRKKNGTQGALWLNLNTYYKAFDKFDKQGIWDDKNNDIIKGNKKYTEWVETDRSDKINDQSREYQEMLKSIENTTLKKDSNFNWKDLDNDYYAFGPFTATFTDKKVEEDTDSGKVKMKYAGISKSLCTLTDFNENKIDSGNWDFCHDDGTLKTPISGGKFYIKVKKSSLKGNGNTIKFTLGARRMTVKAEWYTYKCRGSDANDQMRLYLLYAYRDWIPSEASQDITIPSLEITKQDNITKAKLSGMEFVVKNSSGYYLTSNPGNTFATFGTNNKNKALKLVTNGEGKIKIAKIQPGTYTIEEVGVGGNWEYEVPSKNTTEVTVNGETKQTIGNTKTKMKLSGYAWVDRSASGKESEPPNGYYQKDGADNKDKRLQGVTVYLKNRKTGKIEQTATTDGNGAYTFIVKRAEVENYYVEFEYDGLKYENVVAHITESKGSKAQETTREAFNETFNTVNGETKTTGYTENSGEERKRELEYTIKDHKATLKNVETTENNTTVRITNKGKYGITANTDATGYKITNPGYTVSEIKDINLGVYERAQPFVNTQKDIESVRVSVNGKTHVYNYASRKENEGKENANFNVGVKFGKERMAQTYYRAVYKADYEYINKEDTNKELSVDINYKITLTNNSTTLTTKVWGLVDYYDNRYKSIKVGAAVDANTGEITEAGITIQGPSKYNDKYQKAEMWKGWELKPGESQNIYVQLKMNRKAVKDTLDSSEQSTLDNVVEILSYSTTKDGKTYAGIDEYSNPGNAIPGDESTYEADTDKSPSLKLEIADTRKIEGTVFVDGTEPKLKTGEERKGNGIYDREETTIKDVDVTIKNGEKVAQWYDETTKTWKDAITKTDEKGNFEFTGIVAGDYTIEYTWGDNTYTVQNYKGTIYNEKERQNDKEWYKKNVEIRYSDAIDNWSERQKIDAELKTITNQTMKKELTNTKMHSTTPTMSITVENTETTTTAVKTDETTSKLEYDIKNVDFGIVERARQSLKIDKRIKNMKVTLANGSTLTDVELIYDEATGETTLKGSKSGVVYLPSSGKGDSGTLKLEMDSELIEGAKLEVKYEFIVKNQSELDYDDEKYYKYGEVAEGLQARTLKVKNIIDYLDVDWDYDSTQEGSWQITELDELRDQYLLASDVLESKNIKNRRILTTKQLKEFPIKPDDYRTRELTVSKLLTTSKDIELENEAEILEIEKDGGGKITNEQGKVIAPGNYLPGTGPHVELDDDMAEKVIITPNTGENRNYITITIIGIVSLVILFTGIVIIKKKVIKDK